MSQNNVPGSVFVQRIHFFLNGFAPFFGITVVHRFLSVSMESPCRKPFLEKQHVVASEHTPYLRLNSFYPLLPLGYPKKMHKIDRLASLLFCISEGT